MASHVPTAVSCTPLTTLVLAVLVGCGWTAADQCAVARIWSTPSAAVGTDGDEQVADASLTATAHGSVDSTYPGYRVDVAVDGRWFAPGDEHRPVTHDSQRFGNGDNTWVSGDAATDRWIALEWAQPVRARRFLALQEVRLAYR